MKNSVYTFFIIIVSFLAACNTTEKVLKSADASYKYTKAMEWYNKGAYFKAIPVFEELMGLYKGSKTTEEIYYYYCMAHYKQKNYILSAFHFKNYVTKHPYSEYTEEALFMHAESFVKQSPKHTLDQTETYKAIEAYQVFINAYPESDKITYCNQQIDKLRDKLERKAVNAAKLYYRTKNYRAAAVSYSNLLVDFPDIEGEVDIQYKIVASDLKYAEQSILSKQQERFEETILAATNFKNRHKKSPYFNEVVDIEKLAHYKVIESSLNYALAFIPERRIKKLEEVQDVYAVHVAKLKETEYLDDANEVLEQSYFEIVKANFNLAQNSTKREKKKHYLSAIEAYNLFINEYESSNYIREADKLYNAAKKNLKKLNNG